ncbi:MAG TPA: COX15/CtaA family protein, partial [Dongiaceae bacterium]|nr:COX15/CtaA family protein [Dongiaceae bacterium]
EVILTPEREYSIAARLSLATALLMFVLIVIGSVVRTTGSGLACPDWPLCQGRLIPPFEPHVMIEWLHRTVALVVSLLLVLTAGFVLARPRLRSVLGGLAGLALALLMVQVLLGALTVWKLLQTQVVSSHLAVGLLLFSTLLTLALITESRTDAMAGTGGAWPAGWVRPPHLLATFGFVTLLTYGQAVLGGVVSSSHAGLACPDWPTCNGSWFPSRSSLEGIQMLHRWVAYTLVVAVTWAALRARTAPDASVRAGSRLALGFVVAQVTLGICNVFLGTPPWLSAVHLGIATALLAVSLTLTFRAAKLPATRVTLTVAHAR